MHKFRLSSVSKGTGTVGITLAQLLGILGSHSPLLAIDAAAPTTFEVMYDSEGFMLFGVTI